MRGYKEVRQAMYVKRDIEARLLNGCCCVKAKSLNNTGVNPCFCLLYPTRISHLFCAVLYCHLWPVMLYHNFFTLAHERHELPKESYWTQNVCFGFLYNFCPKRFLF